MASKLTSTDIDNIANQGAVRSSPLRKNFTALKNKINEVIDALAAAAIGTTNAETTAARPYHTSLLDRLDSMWKGQPNYVKYGGVVTLNADPHKVDVSAGEAKVDGADVKFAAATSGTIAYASANTRYDVVVVNSDSSLTVVVGSDSATPVFPALSTTQKALYILLVSTTAISLYKNMVSVDDEDMSGKLPSYFPRGIVKRQVFTSSGTWYKPAGVTTAKVLLVGAGGAGGDETGAGFGGAGGGGGAGAVIISNIIVSSNVSITVGATGNTSFGSFVAPCGKDGYEDPLGGAGGAGANALGLGGFAIVGGAKGVAGGYGAGGGGAAGIGDGKSGGAGTSFIGGSGGAAGAMYGGGGGAGGFGGVGGDGGASGSSGQAGQGYGAGGGGGGYNGTGGAGGAGLCIVEWEE
jgi:hypothetical protein